MDLVLRLPLLARSLIFPLLFGALGGCLNRPLEPNDPRTTSTIVEKLTQSRVSKIDLLLMIDNSSSMKDKQDVLQAAVPDLVNGLVDPPCIDAGDPSKKAQPAGPLEKCPAGLAREFEPVLDIHIGIISSSLGGHGSDACPTDPALGGNPTNDDRAHLLSRTDVQGLGHVSTYRDQGFLAWDPKQVMDPPGVKAAGDLEGTAGLIPTFAEMVRGVGQDGCSYESQLESWYRFLVDPEPYGSIGLASKDGAFRVTTSGVDQTLLEERANFLRPDSLLAVIMLTDENDCSIKESGYAFYAAQQINPTKPGQVFHLPRARHECASDPKDACCKSCGEPQGSCPPDPSCSDEPVLDEQGDPSNLRCFDQKRRFGIDFLYPVSRYVDALSQARVPTRQGDLADNPLFPGASLKNPNPDGRTPGSGLVFVAGIVGVPWQSIARRDAMGEPDLESGLDGQGNPTGGLKSAVELGVKDESGHSTWDRILGDPEADIPPLDPLMIESRTPRPGLLGAGKSALAPPSDGRPTQSLGGSNGHEWTPSADLEYACVFDLPTPNDCSSGCDCDDEALLAHNPLCQDAEGNYVKTQFRAKAYPGLRELEVLKGAGDQAIVASVCPAQLADLGRRDYGYRPAIGAILDRLKTRLGGQCLPRKLAPDAAGQVSCLILEARKLPEGAACSCAAPALLAREDVTGPEQQAEAQALEDPVAKAAGWNCFCRIKQLDGEGLRACQNDPSPKADEEADGWCYVDATTWPPTGDPSLVASCAATERRKIRFVGAGQPLDEATLFITCSGD